MIVITVKYNGPTNTRGSRWTATMSDNRGGKISCTNPFLYGNEDGSQDAALKVLLKWADNVNLERTDASDWIIKRIGEDYRGDLIYTAHMA